MRQAKNVRVREKQKSKAMYKGKEIETQRWKKNSLFLFISFRMFFSRCWSLLLGGLTICILRRSISGLNASLLLLPVCSGASITDCQKTTVNQLKKETNRTNKRTTKSK